ncbi:MAG: B12-binding domain-containing radical SAM protein [Thermoplasmatota archaeon]
MNKDRKVKFVMINPTADLWRVEEGKGPSSKSRIFRFSMLPSLYVCASMPDWIEPRIIDEDVEPIPMDLEDDIIGISFMTYNAKKAYDLGDHFKKMGKTVIFGGYHPSFMPEEALPHCDSICIGEAEVSVPKMMEDWKRGELKPIYRSGRIDLKGLPVPDRSLLKARAYVMPNAVNATRGCPHDCEFCSVSKFFENKHMKRPVNEVVEEIKGLKGKYFIFIDDNLTADRDYALALFKELEPLNKRWYGQTSIRIASDVTLTKAAYRSGARGFFIGLESLSQDTLNKANKRFCKAEEYKKYVKTLHDHGIFIMASVVFGWDDDRTDVFEKTLKFLKDANVDNLQATIYTPFPGTDLYRRLLKEGRTFDESPTLYDFSHAVFDPKHMTREELEQGFCYVMDEFYSIRSLMIRTIKQLGYGSFMDTVRVSAGLSLGYRNRIKAKKFRKKAEIHREEIGKRSR